MKSGVEPPDGGGEARSLGHHFLIGLEQSPVLSDHDKRLLSALRPAGIVLFRDNFRHDLPYEEWLEVHARQIAELREVVERERFVVAIDHEGGRVQRTPRPITDFGEAADWGARASEVGAAMGEELATLGINLNFAPVVDVDTNAANPIIGRRAFGSEPAAVTAAARAFLEAQQKVGVVGCLKHFPGHGDTAADSHLEMPVVDARLELLRERELAPFTALVEEGVQMVMTAHILYPQWDPVWPATLSSRIVEELLRREAGYERVVVTDDVGMAAVSELFDRPDTPARALEAGCDLIAICAHLTDTSRAVGMAEALARSRRDGRLADATLERSRERIERLLSSLSSFEVSALAPAVLARHQSLADAIRKSPAV